MKYITREVRTNKNEEEVVVEVGFLTGVICNPRKHQDIKDGLVEGVSVTNNEPYKLLRDMSLQIRTGKDKVEYMNLTAWGMNAENMAKIVEYGDNLSVFGRINRQEYKNKEGVMVESVTLNIERFTKIYTTKSSDSSTEKSTEGNKQESNSTNQSYNQEKATTVQKNIEPAQIDISDDDLPF